MNKNIRLRRQESTTASAPSLIASSTHSPFKTTGNDSNLIKTSNETVKLSAQQLKAAENLLITKSTSSLLSIQQDRISNALKLKRKNLFKKSASEDSNIQQKSATSTTNANLQSDIKNPVLSSSGTQFTDVQQHRTKWKRFLQLKRGKSDCESSSDLRSSSLTSSTETEASNEINLKASNKGAIKLKHFLTAQSTKSLTNIISNKLDNTKLDDNTISLTKPDSQIAESTNTAASLNTAGFRYHKRRRSKRGSYRLRSNRALTTQYFRTSFDSAVQNQITKRNAKLILQQDSERACSFDNSCLTSSLNYSNQTISSLGISYLIDDVHQLSLDDER